MQAKGATNGISEWAGNAHVHLLLVKILGKTVKKTRLELCTLAVAEVFSLAGRLKA